MNAAAPRYAIYYAPPATSPLWRFGSAAIGYDAASRHDEPFLDHPGFSVAQWTALTDEPRRYGFHATLKAPFHLADATDEAMLLRAVDQCAAELSPVALPELKVELLTRFAALVTSADPSAISDLAQKLVVELDRFRAPLSQADLDRRLKSTLTARQRDYLDRYGYPFVAEEFRFHMTLSGPVPEPDRKPVHDILAAAFNRMVGDELQRITDVAVFRQETRSARFHIIHRAPLGG